MCLSTPKVPTPTPVPSLQATKLPDGGNGAGATADALARRRGLMATILTGVNGAAPGSTTGTSATAAGGKATLGG